MSRHYFPSVLDDFEKQSAPSEESSEPTPQQLEVISNTAQKIDPKYDCVIVIVLFFFAKLLLGEVKFLKFFLVKIFIVTN